MDTATAILRCARCRGELTPSAGFQLAVRADADQLTCRDCGRSFPVVDGMPLLVDDPDFELQQWAYQLHELVTEIDRSCQRILAQLAGERLRSRSRARLQRLLDGLPVHRDRIVALFEAIGVRPEPREKDDRPRVPGEGTITAYYHQIHRDWAWADDGEREIEVALDKIGEVIPVSSWPSGPTRLVSSWPSGPTRLVSSWPSGPTRLVSSWPSGPTPAGHRLGRTLVLGAGPARLSWELATRFGADPCIALDLNPLPYLVARRLQKGQTVTLFELPVVPRTTHEVMVERVLRPPGPPPQNLSLVFGDALDPPVADASFDTVVTPWFIDQVPTDFAELLGVLRRVLRDDGVWINHGPAIYHPGHTRLAHRYLVDEVLELTEAAGFAIERHTHLRVPYMASPASAQGRTEMVLTMFARKQALPTADDSTEPAWLADPTIPVPRIESLEDYRAPHPMFAAVVELIDGKRTVADIAAALVERHGVPEAAATGGVQAVLREIWRGLDSGSGSQS